MTLLALILGAAALAPGVPASPPSSATGVEIRFTGRTTADSSLIRDTMREIARFSTLALKCDRLDGVVAAIQPEGWQPSDPNFRIGPAGTLYERWEVSQCGRVVPFLVGFWKAPEGGTLFQVAHPFPAEPAAPPRR